MPARLLLAAAVVSLLTATVGATPIEIVPPELRGAVQPQVAVAPSGRIHVVFGKDNAVYHTTMAPGRCRGTGRSSPR
jgi:hypothetical protein